MTIEEYREEFLARLRSNAQAEGNLNQQQFIEEAVNMLESSEELIDPIIFPCNMIGSRNRNLGFHAYAYGEADSTIQLLITDFVDSSEPVALTNDDIKSLYNKMQYFILDAVDNQIEKNASDLSDHIIDIAKEFRNKIGIMETSEITGFRFYIVTNKTLSLRVKSLEVPDILNRPATLQVWSLERFYDNFRSSQSERIQIKLEDWNIKGIQCLKANISNCDKFDSYMGIVPGLLIAKLFKRYQAPLLEGNIRCFLSAKGKYNKAIKGTITGPTPERFFTYNNGIAVVANSVKLSEDGRYITEFDGFQIVNGGQTTVSLCNAYIKGEAPVGNLEKIYVPMKLTVLNFNLDDIDDPEELQAKKDEYNELVQQIARTSNWQNPTKEADFFSNDPFHREMEKLSTLIENQTPIKPGKISGTFWYYERSAHRYEQQTFNMPSQKRKAWMALYPKEQVITKEKLGMYYNTLAKLPHLVCLGAVRNMPKFAETIKNLQKENPAFLNSFFFRKYVAAKILFDQTDKIINKAPWYPVGGYKAMYVPYTISKIISALPPQKEIDWKRIWKEQDIYPSLAHQIEIVGQMTMLFLRRISNNGNERTYAGKESTWEQYLQEPLTLEQEFINDLADEAYFKEESKSHERQIKFNQATDLYAKYTSLGANYFQRIYDDMERLNLLSFADRDVVRQSINMIAKFNISDRQVKKLSRILDKLETDTDYMLPDA